MRLLCAISHHGLGHLAQTAPVMQALQALRPDVEWLIWSGLDGDNLKNRLSLGFTHRHEAADMGLVMQDALRVDVLASQQAYQDFHAAWVLRVAEEADRLHRAGIQGVLSNVAYLPLAAAHRAGIPALAFCSLNWWDIAAHYLGTAHGMTEILGQIASAYAEARAFLRLTPCLPMAWLRNGEDLPPVATLGQARPEQLRSKLGLAPATRLVVLGFGGVAYQGSGSLPHLKNIVWLAPDSWSHRGRSDVVGFRETGLSFPDILASCDALISKPGYGSFVEAGGLGLPVLYLDRPDWPETPWLSRWLAGHGRLARLDEPELFSTTVGARLERLWREPDKGPAQVAGAPVIARRILEILTA